MRPGSVSSDHRVADAGDPQGVLDVLGIHVEAVGQDDDVLDPAAQDEPAGLVEVADVAGPVPAVVGEGLGRQVRGVPVARKTVRPRNWISPSDARRMSMPSGARPTVPGPWSSSVVQRAGPGLRGTVALQHGDADVLPGRLERGRQERPGRQEQPEVAAELGVEAGEQPTADRVRQASGDGAQSLDDRRPAALVDLALDGAPEQVEDLRDDDHARDPVLAQGVEDDPRVAAADVQDVGTDIERVVQPDGLLEQVGQRQQRDEPVVHRRHDAMERLDRGDDVVMAEHDALGGPGRAAREDRARTSRRRSGRRQAACRASQSGGNAGSSAAGSAASSSTEVVGKSSRPASRGSGASRPVPRMR